MAVSLYCDMKFSRLDYRIHLITRAGVSDGVTHDLCDELLSSRPCDIGIFLRHFRKNFPDLEAILSDLALQTLVMREKAKLFSTIASERGHARERKNLNANTGPGKNFLHHRRLDLLACVRTRHINAGGLDPLGKRLPRAKKKMDVPAIEADPFVGKMPAPLLQQLTGPSKTPPTLADVVAAGGWPLQAPQAAALESAHEVTAPPDVGHNSAGSRDIGGGRGGSVYMTIWRAKMAAFKMSVCGRKLALAECASVREAAKQERAAAEQEGGRRWKVWLDLFNQEVVERQSGVSSSGPGTSRPSKPVNTMCPYKQHWGAGSPALPITPQTVVGDYDRHGCPSDEVVFKSDDHIVTHGQAVHLARGHRLCLLACICRRGSLRHLPSYRASMSLRFA